jgi:hypothetical protein
VSWADIYGPAEELAGFFKKEYGNTDGLFYTKVRCMPQHTTLNATCCYDCQAQ